MANQLIINFYIEVDFCPVITMITEHLQNAMILQGTY